jgi:hypothetical protein
MHVTNRVKSNASAHQVCARQTSLLCSHPACALCVHVLFSVRYQCPPLLIVATSYSMVDVLASVSNTAESCSNARATDSVHSLAKNIFRKRWRKCTTRSKNQSYCSTIRMWKQVNVQGSSILYIMDQAERDWLTSSTTSPLVVF